MPELPLSRVAALQSASQLAVQTLPIEAIEPNPYQARITFVNLEELAAAIQAQGFTSRLRVRPHPEQVGRFQLVFGERRLRAAKLAGLVAVPCEIAPHSDADMVEIGLAENIQREDLEPIEEAHALHACIEQRGYSIRQLAERIGKSKGYIQNRLDLLRAPEDVQQMVREHPETFTTGLLIAQVPTSEQRQPLIDRVIRGDVDKATVRSIVRDVTLAAAGPAHVAKVGSGFKPNAETAPDQATHSSSAGSPPDVDQNRQARQSERALVRATQTLRVMSQQLHTLLPELQAQQRHELLTFIVNQHFPELEQIVAQLQAPGT